MSDSLMVCGPPCSDWAAILAQHPAVTRALVYPVAVAGDRLFAAYLQTSDAALINATPQQAFLLGRQVLKQVADQLPQPLPRLLWRVGHDWPFQANADDAQHFQTMFHIPPSASPKQPILLDTAHEGELYRFRFQVPPDLVFLQGHFEQEAVVAGVCELTWLSHCIAQVSQQPLQLTRMEAVKFHRLLFPGDVFQLEMKFDANKNKWTFKCFTPQHKVASGRLCVATEAE